VRTKYEHALTPGATDELNALHLSPANFSPSPLGTPVPFSAYLIGQLVNPTGYSTQFNLDSDRSFAYLTWDWVRGTEKKPEVGLTYLLPNEPPPDADRWARGTQPLQLKYVDPPDRLLARPRLPKLRAQGKRLPRKRQ
jgi:hypothetical protein